MSAPQTNIERQKRRHAGPIIGIIAGVLFAIGLMLAYTTVFSPEEQPPGALTDQDLASPTITN